MPIGTQGTFALCKAKEARIALCNEKVSLPPRTDMLVPPGFWRGFFFGPQPSQVTFCWLELGISFSSFKSGPVHRPRPERGWMA
jgi:hypothetical protein